MSDGDHDEQLSEEEIRQIRQFEDIDLSECLTVDEARERLSFE